MGYIDTEFDQNLQIAQKLVTRADGSTYYVGDYELPNNPFRKSEARSLMMSGSLFVLSTMINYNIWNR